MEVPEAKNSGEVENVPEAPSGNKAAKPTKLEPTLPYGKLLALQNLRRQLTDEELATPGVQKLLLDMVEVAETEKESIKEYVQKYNEADKKASILAEKLNKDRKIDVFFGVGIGLGGVIIGLSPYFFSLSSLAGTLCCIIGALMMIGSTLGRVL
jgi:VIT1/CCC1 family predicted Fe2+/Mn2+ transporter